MTFKGITSVDFKEAGRHLYKKAMETDVLSRAATVGFYFSFALFPLLFFLVTLFGLVLESTEGLREELFSYLAQIMPASASDLVHNTMNEVIENSSGGKLTLGIFLTLWSASAGVDSIRGSLNAVYELDETRAWWKTKVQSIVLTLLFIVLVAIVLSGVTYGWQLVQMGFEYFGYVITSPWVLVGIQWSAILLVMLFATEVVYSWIPNFKEFRWVWISPGAVVAILLWLVFSSAFRIYLSYFNSYNKTYGSLGAVIILMLWMYLTGLALLLGGAINSVLTEMSKEQKIPPPPAD